MHFYNDSIFKKKEKIYKSIAVLVYLMCSSGEEAQKKFCIHHLVIRNLSQIVKESGCKTLLFADIGAKDKLEFINELQAQTEMYAFEPNAAEHKILLEKYRNSDFNKLVINQTALSDTIADAELIITEGSSMSSLLLPDMDNYKKHFGEYNEFGSWAENIAVKKKQKVQVSTLDFYFENESRDIDYLKLDTQGTELQILKGAETLLKNKRINVIKAEVSTIPIYKGQAFFSDIDIYLRSLGYVLIDFVTYRDNSKPMFKSSLQKAHYGPCGDAIYVLNEDLLDKENKIRCGIILSWLGYHSLAVHFLKSGQLSEGDISVITKRLSKEKKIVKNLFINICPPVVLKLLKKFR